MGCVVVSGGGERFTARCIVGAGLKPPCVIVLVDAGGRSMHVARRLADASGCRLLEYHTGGRVDPVVAGGIAGELAGCRTIRACVSGGGVGVLHVLSALGLLEARGGSDITLCWETRRVEHCLPFRLLHPPMVSEAELKALVLLHEAGGRVEDAAGLIAGRLGFTERYAYMILRGLKDKGFIRTAGGVVEVTEPGVALAELETRLRGRKGSLEPSGRE